MGGARIFDIGAHQGVVAAMLAREVGAAGQVVAVEPSAHNVAAAEKNKDLNHLPQIEVVQAAISDKSGTLVFNANSLCGRIDDGTGANGRITVRAVTIDELAEGFGSPDIVFIDVEGAECLALAGAQRILTSPAHWLVEVHVGQGLEQLGGSVDDVLAHFPANRFALFGRADDQSDFRPLTKNDPLAQDRFFLLALARSA